MGHEQSKLDVGWAVKKDGEGWRVEKGKYLFCLKFHGHWDNIYKDKAINSVGVGTSGGNMKKKCFHV